jgi:serine protease AprX
LDERTNVSKAAFGARGGTRGNALWGSGNDGDHRSNALWGKGGRGFILLGLIAVLTLGVPVTAGADDVDGNSTYIAPGVRQAAEANPNGKIQVIIQSTGGSKKALEVVRRLDGRQDALRGQDKELSLINAVAVEMKAKHVLRLAEHLGLTVTMDAPVKATSYSSGQLWPYTHGVSKLWGTALSPAPKAPTIAIVDSGIEKGLVSFGDGSRIVQRQVFTTLQPNTGMDGRGHGTFVAGIAAGQAPGYAGASPTSDLVDLDVMDDRGMARTSDVIEACEWIYEKRTQYNIKVANFSLHSSSVLSIKHHPLNRAVEKLWFAGVTVVAAAGNYGVVGGPSGVKHAPGNDPFVITVGAVDLENSAWLRQHDVPSWSAYGYTNEGFVKPDVVAAGRYMVGPVSPNATLKLDKPLNVLLGGGYMRLSGTSFAAPVVSGIAAQILARHPEYTPDRVKGVLMATARRMPDASALEQGRGEVNAVRAVSYPRVPPNVNSGLLRFVITDPYDSSGRVFDATAWYDAMKSDSAWDSSAWSDSGWADSAWNDSAWNDSAWLDSAWLDSAWNDSAWADSSSYEDNAEGDGVGVAQLLDSEDAAVIAGDPDLNLPLP